MKKEEMSSEAKERFRENGRIYPGKCLAGVLLGIWGQRECGNSKSIGIVWSAKGGSSHSAQGGLSQGKVQGEQEDLARKRPGWGFPGNLGSKGTAAPGICCLCDIPED